MYTKNYCLPKLIDSQQLMQIIHVAKGTNGPADFGTRDLIPYVCLYNGVSLLNQIANNPNVQLEEP